MKNINTLYERCEPYICYKGTEEEVYNKYGADRDEVVVIFSSGSGVLVKDFWNYHYKITDITINSIIAEMDKDEPLLLIGNNVLVNMKYVDSLTSEIIQIGDHLIPIDDRIKENIESYRKLIHKAKNEHYLKEDSFDNYYAI